MIGALLNPASGYLKSLTRLVESRAFTLTITVVIVINAITLGLETSPAAMAAFGPWLLAIDSLALWVFTAELTMKFIVYRGRFFRDGWNVFDFMIVAIAWLPATGPLAVLRALRIIRVLRLVTVVPQLRKVVGALLQALPGMGSIIFAADFPDWFGSIGASMFSLFQIMTLESWSMGIVRPVMEVHPNAWLFFVPFIVMTSFTVLNLFIALIVNSMQAMQSDTRESIRTEAVIAHDERTALARQLDELTAEVRSLKRRIK